jgi:hypothetical protein
MLYGRASEAIYISDPQVSQAYYALAQKGDGLFF